jgi:transmembrane sensor
VTEGKSKRTLADEAAAWVARLKDSHSTADRRRFERWLAQDPARGSAYDRALASYDASGLLRASSIGRGRDLARVFPSRGRRLARSLAFASIAGLLLLAGYEIRGGLDPLRPVALETVLLSSGAKERIVTLADGSKVSMAPGSEVRVELKADGRLVEIRRGRVRLVVANEGRPFRIVAGGRAAEAKSGTFDAEVAGERGTITASTSPKGDSSSASGAPGQQHGQEPVRQMVEFRSEPLGKAVARINRVHAGPLLVLDPALAGLRVTGIFQQGSSEAIARSLALAFDLRLVRTSSGTLLLQQQK